MHVSVGSTRALQFNRASEVIMVSQPVLGAEFQVFEIHSYIRGYHVFKDVWTPTIGEILHVQLEPTNDVDWNALALLKENVTVGHVP